MVADREPVGATGASSILSYRETDDGSFLGIEDFDDEQDEVPAVPDEPFVSPDGEGEPTPQRRQEQSEVISLVRVILEREIGRVGSEGGGRDALERLLELPE